MKIGLFTDCYYPQINGVVTSVMILKEELEKLGHDVYVVTVKVPSYEETDSRVLRLTSVPFKKWKEFRVGFPFSYATFRQLKELELDVIHTHTEFSIGLLGKTFAKLSGIPLVHTYHTMYEDYTHYIYNLKHGVGALKKIIQQTTRAYLKGYQSVVAPSMKTQKALVRYGVTEKVTVIPTGINITQFERLSSNDERLVQLRNQLGLTETDKILLSLGRVSEEKSIDVLIRSLAKLLESDERYQLIIVGDGPYLTTLRTLAEEMEITNHVHFVGRVAYEQVCLYYSLADVFVNASRTETQGLTIMEAMAAGLPVVVYDDTNVEEVVIANYSGCLFKTENELVSHVQAMFTELSKRDDYVDNAHRVVKALSKELFARKIEKAYLESVIKVCQTERLFQY